MCLAQELKEQEEENPIFSTLVLFFSKYSSVFFYILYFVCLNHVRSRERETLIFYCEKKTQENSLSLSLSWFAFSVLNKNEIVQI